jgi:hypothetical protein
MVLACVIACVGTGLAHADPDPLSLVEAQLFTATNVSATGIGPTSIYVAWTDNSTIETAYRIEIAMQQAGPYATAGWAPSCDVSAQRGTKPVCSAVITVTPASDPLPRWVRVVPVLEIGQPTVNSPSAPVPSVPGTPPGQGVYVAEGQPSDPDPAILSPAPPTGLRCEGGCHNVTDIKLTWQDNSDESQFWVMRAPNSPQPKCANRPWGTTPFVALPANTTSYQTTILDYGLTFFFKVVAVRVADIVEQTDNGPIIVEERSFSDSDCVSAVIASVPAPANPDGLTATFSPPSTTTLSWTDEQNANYPAEDGWFVEFGPSSTVTNAWHETTRAATSGGGTMSFVDNSVPADSDRCYQVRAYRAGPSYSHYTNMVCIGVSVPKAPTNLTALAVSNSQVNLAWVDNSTTEQFFAIQRCTGTCTASSTGWLQIATTQFPDVVTFSDQNTVASTTYSYRVFAVNEKGPSAPSNIAVVKTMPEPVKAPSNLSAVAQDSHSIALNWIDNSLDETGFRIEYRNDATQPFATLTDVPANTQSYVDSWSLNPNQNRCYRVRALKGPQQSDPSNIACVSTAALNPPNGAPANASAAPVSNTATDLTFTDNATNEDSFRVDILETRNTTCAEGNPKQLDDQIGGGTDTLDDKFFTIHQTAPKSGTTTVPTTVTYRVNGLTPHSAYFFRVRAVNKDGVSDRSNTTRCVTTKGPALPVWEDPAQDQDVKATRCDVTLNMPLSGAFAVSKVRIYVNAYVNGVASATDTVWGYYNGTSPPNATTNGGDSGIAINSDTNGNHWVLNYHFRKGPTYRLMATAYDQTANQYASATAARLDVTVLADCPQSLPN